MGLELELSELGALRPIRVVAVADDARATPRSDEVGDGGGADADADGDTGLAAVAESGATETARQGGGGGGDGGDAGCVTPTSVLSVLRPAAVCPPAPRKTRLAKTWRRCCGGGGGRRPPPPAGGPRFFPVPRDLTAVFIARGAELDCPPPAKKIRIDAVG